MAIRVKVGTPAFQVEIEAQDVPEFEKLMVSMREHGLPLPAQLEAASVGGPKPRIPREVVGPLDRILSDEDRTDPVLGVVTQSQKNGHWLLKAKLTPAPDGLERETDAALLLIYAYEKGGEVPVKGGRLLQSLKLSGYSMPRVDRPLESYRSQGLIVVSGAKRGRGYQLTEPGKSKVRQIADELLQTVGTT